MPIRTQIWTVDAQPAPLKSAVLASEQFLEDMIVSAPALLSEDWLLIGRQESTGQGGRIDLLALAPDASLVLIELKRERTPREVVAQALDYAVWVERLQANEIEAIYQRFKPGAFDGDQNRRAQTGLADVDQHPFDKAVTDLCAANGQGIGKDERRVDAGHLGEHRYRIRAQLRATIEGHATLLGAGECHRFDQRVIHQRLANGIAAAAHHREHTFVQTMGLHGIANGACLDFRCAGVRVVCLENHWRAGGQCRRGIATRHRIRDGEIARTKNRHRAEGDFLQAMVHARARLTFGLRRVDRQLQEATLAHHVGELAELGGGPCGFAFELSVRQTGFQCRARRQIRTNGVEVVGNGF